MSHKLRTIVACKLVEATRKSLSRSKVFPDWTNKSEILSWCLRYRAVSKRSDVGGGQLGLTVRNLKQCNLFPELSLTQTNQFVDSISETFESSSLIQKFSQTENGILFNVKPSYLAETILSDIITAGSRYGKESGLFQYILPVEQDSDAIVVENKSGQTLVVDFSSPNIAKLFHAGHLRSTIIGNFVSNINEWFDQKVVRINYLGDWGTQFGLLGIGYEKYCDKEKLNSDPLQHLTDIYVRINQDASNNNSVHNSALQYFQRLEKGESSAMSFWEMCRNLSVREYTTMYERLGVTFDHIHGESMYVSKALKLLKRLSSENLLQTNSETGVGFIDLTEPNEDTKVQASLVKSDGTTLYLTRDAAAAIDRINQFKPDALYYVVENGQHQHFKYLSRMLRKLGSLKTHVNGGIEGLRHIKFGHIKGLSTRQGGAIHLRDLLSEAKQLILHSMKSRSTTKISDEVELEAIAECLAVSALLVQDLKEYRQNNYTFSLTRMLNFNGDTGIFLQYTHARLHSLISHESDKLKNIIPVYDLLAEDSAQRLVQHLARFDEILLKSYTELEPCHLVHYMFAIGRLVNVAHDELYVKGQPAEVAKTRLALFEGAKTVLANGLKILGITPLERM